MTQTVEANVETVPLTAENHTEPLMVTIPPKTSQDKTCSKLSTMTDPLADEQGYEAVTEGDEG